jgi:spermidine synthase
MSETLITAPTTDVAPASDRTTLAGVLVMSFSSLLLELALTRLFSVTLFYHFAFLAISIALLGLGAGGVFAYIKKEWLTRWDAAVLGARLSLINSVLLLVVLEIDLLIPVSLKLTGWNFLKLTAIYLVSALPFFVIGLFFSVLFARSHQRITQLYAADLAGGALACVGVVPLLNFVGGPSTIIAAAAASALAAVIWTRGCPTLTDFGRVGSENQKSKIENRKSPGFARVGIPIWAVLLALVAVANYSGKLVDIVYAKGMRRNEPWVAYARWNALSRVEVDDQGVNKVIVIDADASTYLMNTDAKDMTPKWRHDLMAAPSSLANVLRPTGNYAIIGPGGGVDILRAVANGSPNVTGIEINPIIVNDIMRGRYADYTHHLYTRPEVHINIADGRSWVRNSREQYDVLQMTLVDTWASTAAGAFALSENNLYTTEAFREYFDHLKPDGFIAITRWEFTKPREALRVVSQAIAALSQLGVHDVSRNFIVISDGPLSEDGRAVTVLAKKTPFTQDEEFAVLDHVQKYPNLYLLYTPSFELPAIYAADADVQDCTASAKRGSVTCRATEFLRQRRGSPQAAVVFREFIKGMLPEVTISTSPRGHYSTQREEFIADYPYNISAVSDNAPFFFFTVRIKDMLGSLTRGGGIDWKVNLGVVVLLMVLAISIVAVLAFLILPLLLSTRPAIGHGPSAMSLLYFIAIGLGFILAEMAFIQRFVLFLGHPTYALTVVIFMMLLASGAGSLMSRRWLSSPRRVWIPLVAVIVLLAAYVFILPPLLRNLIGLPFALKVLVAGVVLIPLGLSMGMPFPTGLRALADAHQENNTIEWAWALNAASSVLGSVMAMLIAIQWGLGVTLACGAAAYLAALLLGRTVTHLGPASS